MGKEKKHGHGLIPELLEMIKFSEKSDPPKDTLPASDEAWE